MKKSVYSLVLMDDVVRAVDKQAMLLGTSRSNLINQILAEQLSCITPEMRMKEIFGAVEELIGEGFQIRPCRSDAFMTLRTALEYKYRPSVNYKVELLRIPDVYLGTLTIQLRTQSTPLIALFSSFFSYWSRLESDLFASMGISDYVFEIEPGRFSRKLFSCGDDAAQAIYEYITLLDKAIKLYFSAPQDFPAAAAELEQEYKRQLKRTII